MSRTLARTKVHGSLTPHKVLLAGLAVSLFSTSLSVQKVFGQLFVPVTTGPIHEDVEGTFGFGWADYDGDGRLDLLVANTDASAWPEVTSSLYRNNGNGTFTKVPHAAPATKPGSYVDAAWGDYDNDGHLDLFVPNADGQNNDLFRNNGDGTFTDITGPPGSPSNDGGDARAAAWVDFDSDGYLDLFVVNAGSSDGYVTGENDCLYRNNGDGTFTRTTAAQVGAIVTDADPGWACWWGDYDNDGLIDLLRFRYRPGIVLEPILYRNGGSEGFSRVLVSSLTDAGANWGGWVDYDNDGWLDVFGCNLDAPYRLHRNLEGSAFVNAAATAGLDQTAHHNYVGVWGDYDNDGFVDLLIAHSNEPNALYQNQGDGTFALVAVGDDVPNGSDEMGIAWIDFDNDGFLDVFIANFWGADGPLPNDLFRNNLPNTGNTNSWLKIKLNGSVSNRSGIGARLRAAASLNGRPIQQMWTIGCGESARSGTSGLLAHFGLGDATQVDTLRIEWPSGIVQELKDVPANQILTVTEPPRLIPQGIGAFQIQCWINQSFDVEASTDLASWSNVATLTNTTGTLVFDDAEADQHQSRYYRVVAK